MQRHYKKFGQYLKRARKNCGLGLTQAELARKIGFNSGQIISNIEQGRSPVPTNLFGKLALILNIDLIEMVDAYLEDEKEKIINLTTQNQGLSPASKMITGKNKSNSQDAPCEFFL